MRWQWIARIVVAAIGIGAAIAIVVYSHRRPPPAQPVTTLQKINPDVVTKAGPGVLIFRKTGKNPVKLTSAGSEQDRSGRQFFTGVLIEGLEADRFTIKADRLDMQGPDDNPSIWNVSGHVVVATSDGLTMETETGTYDNATGRLNLPKHVSYTRGRISGTALAGGYDRDQDAVTLLGDATAHVRPDPTGKGAAEATATRMTLARGQHRLDMDEHARIVGDIQVLTSNTAIVTFTDDESAIKLMELHGAAHVTPRPGAAGAADQPDMTADAITMAFRPDGVTLQHAALAGQASLVLAGASTRSIKASSIDVSMAPDGHTLTGLKANEHVVVDLAATETTRARTITSASLDAVGDDTKGLTSARFDGSPEFSEEPESSRAQGAAPAPRLRGSGITLVLKLGGQLDAIETAVFQQHAKFTNGDATAKGDIAEYDQARDVVHFTANAREPRQRPQVQNGDIEVDAWKIDLNTGNQNLSASGNVTTQSRSQSGPTDKAAAALFDAGEVVSGKSDSLEYMKSTGVTTYRGGAKLWQGNSSIQADQIHYTDTSGKLDASGHVDSTWVLAPAPSATPAPGKGTKTDQQKYTVSAETLVYDDAAREATFTAPDVVLRMADGEIRSASLTLRLAAAARELDQLDAVGNVWAHLSGDYDSVSDTLVYHAAKNLYVLRGKPGSLAQVKSPNKDSKDAPRPEPSRTPVAPMCTVQTGLHFEIDRNKDVGPEQPGVSQAVRTTTTQPCSVPLKRGGK